MTCPRRLHGPSLYIACDNRRKRPLPKTCANNPLGQRRVMEIPIAPANISVMQAKTIKVAQFGLGPIGLESVKLAAEKPWIELVGGIDIDPAKLGKTLGDLTRDV